MVPRYLAARVTSAKSQWTLEAKRIHIMTLEEHFEASVGLGREARRMHLYPNGVANRLISRVEAYAG
jgi:hypothetical protein